MYIHSSKIYTPQGCIDGILHIENGKIVEILNKDANVEVDWEVNDHRILPGIIDTHNHGTMGYSLMGEFEDLEKIVRGYLKGAASQGVTACLPTADYHFFKAIAKVAKTEIDGAKPIGIHSEGPYLSRVGEKGINLGYPDIDMNHVKAMVDDAEGMLKLVAIAPEIPGAKEAIEYWNAQGVRCAYAHSDLMYKEALESFKWGITVTTHTANVMEGIHHRRMGGLGACLLSDDVYNEMICDGLHVSNEMMELMLRVKRDAFNKVLMVSDNVAMSGAPIGRYRLGDKYEVTIDELGYCLSDTGRLMGSTVPVIKGIKNLRENMGLDMLDIIKMSSENPAKVYDAPSKGKLEVGMDADFIVIDDDYNVLNTFVEGKCVFDSKKDTDLFNPDFLAGSAL